MTEKTKKLRTYIFDTFKEIVEDIRHNGEFVKPFEFTVNREGDNFYIFIIGNKVAGRKYELETWKSDPVVSFEVRRYSEVHPTIPNQEYVDLRVHYCGGWSSEYAEEKYIDNGLIKNKLTAAIKTAIKDFTIQEVI